MPEIPENPQGAPNRMPRRPFDLQVPFWATANFRWLVIFAVMFLALVVVLVFDILPKLQGKRMRETPPPPPLSARERAIRFDGVLNTVKDGTPIEMGERAYQYLVRHLETMESDALAKTAKEVSYVHFANQPDDLRGESIKIQALVADSYPLRLDPQVGEREWVYRTLLVDFSAREAYFIDLLDPPPKVPPRSVVQVEGLFIKNATYEATGGVMKTVPLLIGRRMTLVDERGAARAADMERWIIGVGTVAAVCFVLFSIRIYRQARRGRSSILPVTKIS